MSGFLLTCVIVFSFHSVSYTKPIDWQSLMPEICVDDLRYIHSDNPITLNISLRVHAIYDISEEKMEFGMQIELVEFWEDRHLKFPSVNQSRNATTHLLPQKIIDCIWKPDTLFPNAKEMKLYSEPSTYYKILLPKGHVLRKRRYKIIAACPMMFDNYPMDSQKCSVLVSLFHSRQNTVLMNWSEDFKNVYKDETPLNYAIRTLPLHKSVFKKSSVAAIVETLHANFLFERSLWASLFNTYVPSFLVVCLSMVSFWLDVNAVPGRVTLGVTAILTLSTQIVQARSGLPVLDYMTAMDVWLLGCLLMVFLSLIEFTLAHSYERNLKVVKEVSPKASRKSSAWAVKDNETTSSEKCKRCPKPSSSQPEISSIKTLPIKWISKIDPKKDNFFDRISRILFPCVMLIFSSTYWLYFSYNAYS